MQKVILYIVFSCFVNIFGYSQMAYLPLFHSIDTADFSNSKKVQYGLQMGTGFSSYAGGMSSTYYNPYVTFKASKKLFVQTGITTQNYNIGGFSATPSFGKSLPNQSQSVVVNTSALYKVNSKLNVYTAMYGSFGQSGMVTNGSNNALFQQTYGNDSRGVSFGLEYQLRENVKISGQFQYIKNAPYNPLESQRNFMSPYYSPFNGAW